jgi:superfamily II DNA/RNA helicase
MPFQQKPGIHYYCRLKGIFMTFAELNLTPSILKAISACGYTSPTPIQAEAIPIALAGHDLIGTAQTGTGKTASFVLPALQKLSKPSELRGRGPRVLVLTPTRELANQVTEAVKTYGRFTKVRSGAILGGMSYRDQLRLLSQPVDFIVATPGRLVDHLENRKIDFSRLEMLILDEADRMLDMGFSEDIDKIAAATPEGRQTLMFTATLDATAAKLAGRMLRDPQRVEIAGKKVTLDVIEQRLHVADNIQHKNRLLKHLLSDVELSRAIIFSATKRDADALAQELFSQGHSAAALHGDMTQGARNRTISDLKKGRVKLLVATDVAARGLDVNGISHVINFDLPRFAEDYVHRIGRTGRAGASGTAISFVSVSELNYLDRIERFIGQKLPRQVIEGLEPTRDLPRFPVNSKSGAGRGKKPGAANSTNRAWKGEAGKSAAPVNDRRKKWGAPRPQKEVVVEYRRPSGDRRSS